MITQTSHTNCRQTKMRLKMTNDISSVERSCFFHLRCLLSEIPLRELLQKLRGQGPCFGVWKRRGIPHAELDDGVTLSCLGLLWRRRSTRLLASVTDWLVSRPISGKKVELADPKVTGQAVKETRVHATRATECH